MLKYKSDVDILSMLKEKGYSTYRIRKEKLIPEGSMQRIREHRPIDWVTIETICRLLNCQPGDFLVYVEDNNTDDG